MIFLILVFLAIIGTFIFLRDQRRKPFEANRPPGLKAPVVFTILRMFMHSHIGKFLSELGKAHGPIIYGELGPFKGMLLNGADTIREACKLTALNGRIDCMYKDIMGQQGLLYADKTTQKRKFFFRSAKHFGLGIASAESNIHEEITLLFKYFDSFENQAFSVKGAFNIPTLNGIMHRFMGEKFPHDDPVVKSIVERLHTFTELPGPILRACVFAPSLTKWVPRSLSGRNFMEKLFQDGLDIIYPLLEKHFKTRTPKQPRDLADALLDEVEGTKDIKSVFHNSKDPIQPLLFDMFSAAIETTGSVLEWTILYLSQYPEAQAKLQAEVDNIIGRERLPELSDRPQMPYLQAFMQEMFRIAPVVPLWYHMAIEDTEFQGYSISKGTYVIGNFFGIHMDPDLWENPEEFNPERFINQNGDFVKSDQIFTFGFGKRSCIGEVTARDQLFLYLARQAQTYTVSLETKLPSLDGSIAVGYHPPPFKASFIKRY